jgi:ribosomal protein L11 methyltransferase
LGALLVVDVAADEVDEVSGRLWLSELVTSVFEQPSGANRVELRAGVIESASPERLDGLVADLGARWTVAVDDDTAERALLVASMRAAATPVRVGDLLVSIDPGLAFGSGSHPTTRLVLAALEVMVRPGASVLDVGTGTGVLAIAAARLGADRVVAVDIDAAAVDVARANAVRNGVDDRIALAVGGIAEVDSSAPFDLVVANLSRLTLVDLADSIVGRLAPSGAALVTGILDEQVDDVVEAFGSSGAVEVGRESTGGWARLELRPAQSADVPGR